MDEVKDQKLIDAIGQEVLLWYEQNRSLIALLVLYIYRLWR